MKLFSAFFVTQIIYLSFVSKGFSQTITPKIVNSAGNSAALGTTVIDWSVGELALISTFSGSSVVITQGILQPLNASATGMSYNHLLHSLNVFPNPAAEFINIEYFGSGTGVMAFRISDMQGRALISNSFSITKIMTLEQIDINSLAAGVYILNITLDNYNEGAISFKINKLN